MTLPAQATADGAAMEKGRALPVLPFEIHRRIIHLCDRPTLVELLRVCKGYHHEALPMLYRHITLAESLSGPALRALLARDVLLKHVRTLACFRCELLHGQRARETCTYLWDKLVRECPKLGCAAWTRSADDHYVGTAAEMIRFLDAPKKRDDQSAKGARRSFEWSLYGDLHDDMVARLTSSGIDLIHALITVPAGNTHASINKLEAVLPILIKEAPTLKKVHIFVGYNLLEIGSRTRRMERARLFQALTERLQLLTLTAPERGIEIVMSPSMHIFPTSVDAVDDRLPAMVKEDFDKACVQLGSS